MQSKLIGDWKIGEIIGRGGQAKVYAASKGEGTPVCALKIINSNQPKKRARFIQEVRKHAELSDRKASNIIPILDHNLNEFENGGRIGFIVMPKAEANLEDQIDIFGGRVEFCLEVFRGIVNGVVQAHGIGIIHRDLKPSNILFMDRSLREPLISDFGICFVKDTPEQKRFTDVNETVGARFFMAPEQERGGIVDVKETADIYTLGKILHYMLTKRYLHREILQEAFEEREIEADPRLRIILDDIISQVVVYEQDKRIQNATQLLDKLDDLIKRFGGKPPNILVNPESTEIQNSFQISFDDKVSKAYYQTVELWDHKKFSSIKIKFDKSRSEMANSWQELWKDFEHKPLQSAKAAEEFIQGQRESIGLTIAMARLNADELFGDFRRLMEFITRLDEGKAGYLAILQAPYVLAGFLYMTAGVSSLFYESWDVMNLIFNQKYEWYYLSGRRLYSYGFQHPYFFHAEALQRSSAKIHDLFRKELCSSEILNIMGMGQEALLEIYTQTQMLMCLRAAKALEDGEELPIFADFGRFYEERVLKLLDRAYNDRPFAERLCKIFDEKPEEWFNKLNARLKTIRGWFKDSEYFWHSITSYEPS